MLELDSSGYDDQYQTDSGVATLSCTDSSTASSDTSDPGSPYSPPSLGDNDLQSPPNAISTPHSKPIPIAPKMPPLTSISQNPTLTTTNRCQQNQPHQWPWNSAQTVLSGANKGTAIATATNNNNINNINNNKLKRPSTDKSDAAANNKKSRSTSTDKLGATGSKKAPTPLIVKNGKVPEKITGYFKTQTKSSTTLKKDISNVVMQSASIAAMPPLTEISPKPKGSESLKKYFSLLAQQAGEKPLKPEFDVRPVQTTLTTSPALITAPPRKPEKKTAKVSPMVSTAPKKSQKLPTISPKKPVTIAPRIAKPTAAAPPIAAKKLPTGMKQLPPPPTVVLTAIRMSPSQAPPPLQPASSTPMSPPKATPTQAKVGPVFSMMPNLVQIPNLVASTPTKAPGLVMNNGLAAARINAAAQLLMNGAVIKLQQMQNAETPISTASGPMPHQLKTFQQKPPQMSYTAPQLFMTNSGIYYNAPLPIYGGIPALQPIQQTLPSINTILPSHHQTAPPPVIPKPSVIPKPVAPITTTASIGSQTTSSYISKMMTPALLSEPPKLVPVSLKVNTALPAVSPAPVPAPAPTVIDLCSPTLPQLSPKAPKVPLSPTSPKSQVLERIRRGASPDLKVDLSISLESVPTPKKEAMLPPPLVPSLPERSKSPMLTEPKIIRFPAQQRNAMRMGVKGARRSDGRSDGACYWDGCNEKFENNSQLLDHLQTHHVNPQTGPFSCLWSGCKVQGKKSCSRTWLERHVLPHGGNRTYKCIVDGCGLRFPSQLALQKHVNKHFTTDKSKSDDKPEQPTAKLIKKNGKKFRYRRQPWSARRVDYFDQGKMEGLQHRLMLVGALASGPKGSICFKGRPMARRTGKMGTEILVKWFPTNIIADEWVSLPSDSKVPEKQMPIKSMSLQEQIELQKFLRHIYKVNRHKMNLDSDSASMSSEISSSSSLSTCSSLDAPAFQQHVISAEESSNSSNPSLHRHQSSFSRTSSMSFSFSSSTTSLSTLSSSLNQQQNGNNVDALSNIRRMTKKYRKPPRTMPS